jgi:hypothetical protein
VHQQFAYGLRFSTELVYRVQQPNGRSRYHRLLWKPSPLVPHKGDETGAKTCAALAAAIASRTKVLPVPRHAAGPDRQDGPEQVVAMLLQRLPGYEVQVNGPDRLSQWVEILARTLRSNGIGMLQLFEGTRARWALVVGLEWSEVNGVVTQRPPAFLLMDVHCSPVWGVGHNARFDPTGAFKAREHRDLQEVPLRTLEGGLFSVRPGALITVCR